MQFRIEDKIHWSESRDHLRDKYVFGWRDHYPMEYHKGDYWLIGNDGLCLSLGDHEYEGVGGELIDSNQSKEDYVKAVLSYLWDSSGIAEDFNFDWSGSPNSLEEQYLRTYENSRDLKPKVDMWRRYKQEGKTQSVIAQTMGINQSTVQRAIAEVGGKLDYDRGQCFEDDFRYLVAPLLFDYYLKDGSHGHYDGLGVLPDGLIQIVSLKCYSETRCSITLGLSDVRPEIEKLQSLLNAGYKATGVIYLYEMNRGKTYFATFNADFERCTLQLD